MFITVFIITVILVGLALVGLGLTMIIKKKGKFPNTHIGRSKAMRDRGIDCANSTDRKERENYHSSRIDED